MTVWQALGASLRVAVIATLIALAVAVTIVAILSRRPRSRALRRAQAAFDAFVMLPLGVSAVTIGFGLLITMHNPLGLPIDLRTSGGLIAIAQALVAIPLVVRIVLPVVRSIDPRQREAAATLGATPAEFCALSTGRSPPAPSGSAPDSQWPPHWVNSARVHSSCGQIR